MHKFAQKIGSYFAFFVHNFFQNLLTTKKASVSIETDQESTPNKEGTKMTVKEMIMKLAELGVIDASQYLDENKIYVESENGWATIEFDENENVKSVVK